MTCLVVFVQLHPLSRCSACSAQGSTLQDQADLWRTCCHKDLCTDQLCTLDCCKDYTASQLEAEWWWRAPLEPPFSQYTCAQLSLAQVFSVNFVGKCELDGNIVNVLIIFWRKNMSCVTYLHVLCGGSGFGAVFDVFFLLILVVLMVWLEGDFSRSKTEGKKWLQFQVMCLCTGWLHVITDQCCGPDYRFLITEWLQGLSVFCVETYLDFCVDFVVCQVFEFHFWVWA